MSIKIIVSDLDGTLLRTDKTISDHTVRVLERCRERGIKFAFATGRPVHATLKYQRRTSPDFVIADNGATICRGGEFIRRLVIPAEMRDKLLAAFLASDEVDIVSMETGDYMYTNYDGPPWEVGWKTQYTDFSGGISADAMQISVDCANLDFVTNVMRDFPELHLYSNHGMTWRQIMCRESTKANAVEYLCAWLGIKPENVAAFGDDYNDVDMIARAGSGVAIAGAIPEVKAAAKFVCGANDDDGIAKWIEEHVL